MQMERNTNKASSDNNINPVAAFFSEHMTPKKPKKIFKRTSTNDSEKSYDSAKRSARSEKVEPQSEFKPSFIKPNKIRSIVQQLQLLTAPNLPMKVFQEEEKKRNCFASIHQNTPLANRTERQEHKSEKLLTAQAKQDQHPVLYHFSPIKSNNENAYIPTGRASSQRLSFQYNRSVEKAPRSETSLDSSIFESKIKSLQSQLVRKRVQIQSLRQQKCRLESQNKQLKTHCKELQKNIEQNVAELAASMEQCKKGQVERKKMEMEKQMLQRKVGFLEKINYTSETKNLQSLREEYLSNEVAALKKKLEEDKSTVEKALQQEARKLRQEVYVLKRNIETLEINKVCMQRKLKQVTTTPCFDEEHSGLMNKYRRLKIEATDLRRKYDALAKQYSQVCKQVSKQVSQDMSFEESLSLELSQFSQF